MRLSSDCLDRWLGDCYEFRTDFIEYCWGISKALDFEFEFNQEIIEAAHQKWCADNKTWLAERMGADSTGLSHIKLMGLLLHHLCRAEWIREVREYPNDEVAFSGSPAQKEEARLDYQGGPEAYMSLTFAMYVINWFESARDDRADEFDFRLTPDMFHDLMFYLLSNYCNEFSVVLILKAIYMRDPILTDA